MRFCWTLCTAAMLLLAFSLASPGARGDQTSPRIKLPPESFAAIARAVPLGRLAQTDQVAATITLRLRNSRQLTDLLRRLSDPNDPEYGHYLTPDEFDAQFSPTEGQYEAVASYAQSEGLTVTGTHADRLIMDVAGTRDAVERAFGVNMYWFRTAGGRVFHAPDRAASVPKAVAGVVAGVVGLSDASKRRPNVLLPDRSALSANVAGPGTGPNGGLAPSDIRTAYDLKAAGLTGAGQTLALFELDGYTASDIAAYEKQFNLPAVPLVNDLVDGATGKAGSGAGEVTLDIELMIALAPDAANIKVYETPNTDTGVLDGYDAIAADDVATEISTSWGLDEPDTGVANIQAEAPIFEKMAAQGQSMFAAAGDNGAYDTGVISDGLTVDDPASQPYVCGVGGTSLTTVAPGGAWKSETTWNNGSPSNGAGGGGISSIWPIPSWQVGAINTPSGASTTMRNVPDVSLNANQNVGYAIYVGGGWAVIGGTSAASPLWAAFTALVNQQRLINNITPLGQASPALYPILNTSDYTQAFHDIADGSTNLFYHAVAGYDDATGLGTYDGAYLLAILSSNGAPDGIPVPPVNLSATTGNKLVKLTWEKCAGATSYDIYRSLVSGSEYVDIGSSVTPTYSDTAVSNNTTYYYVVTAVDALGASADSNVVTATPSIPIIASYEPGINFISLPYDYSIYSLAQVLGYANPVVDVWNPSILSYLATPAGALNHLHLGVGYWARFPVAVTVTQTGTPAATSSSFSIQALPGWNQIGDPFLSSVNLNAVTVVSGGQSYTYADAINAGLIWDLVYQYDWASHSYLGIGAGGSLQPGSGYFLGAYGDVTLQIPPP